MNAVAGWTVAPRPVAAREFLPERALLGDATAIAALQAEVWAVGDAGPALAETWTLTWTPVARSRRAPANCSFIQPPSATRLKRIADFTGRDPTLPRDRVERASAWSGLVGKPGAGP